MSAKDQLDVAIDFDVHYFVQMLNWKQNVFVWLPSNAHILLGKHGIV